MIEAAEGDDASFTRSHIAALTDETKAAIRQWARCAYRGIGVERLPRARGPGLRGEMRRRGESLE